jgi:hypothetical protein
MYLWMGLREHALSHGRVGWSSLCPRYMAASSALLIICVGGVEEASNLRDELEDGWVAAAPSGAEPPFLEPSL